MLAGTFFTAFLFSLYIYFVSSLLCCCSSASYLNLGAPKHFAVYDLGNRSEHAVSQCNLCDAYGDDI